ncbi:MAG TPA: glycosyltransferase, partial [Candidatus Sulfomarinibacteraceae bacterium]|nr:glycosyltransferase [Candidatus Sulfomarinibacteraceae bacterium]
MARSDSGRSGGTWDRGWPADRGRPVTAAPISLTVVVPTLDEELTIGSCLDAIGRPPETVLVVTDGGSTDSTLEIVARQRPDTIVVRGAPGRGGQLRRGVAAAPADGYVFVHADCRLPAGW